MIFLKFISLKILFKKIFNFKLTLINFNLIFDFSIKNNFIKNDLINKVNFRKILKI